MYGIQLNMEHPPTNTQESEDEVNNIALAARLDPVKKNLANLASLLDLPWVYHGFSTSILHLVVGECCEDHC